MAIFEKASLPVWPAILKRQLSLVLLYPLLLSLCLVSNVQASEEGAPVILVVGDSLSAGYGMDIEQSWVSLLQTQLEGQYPHQVVNASVSGETSNGGMARLPALLREHQPQLVILELGGNDGLRGQPLENLHNNLKQMIELSREAGAGVLLLGMRIPPNYGARYANQFADIYPSLAKEYGIPLVGFLLEGIATNADIMQRDGIHPKAEAQPQMLANVWPELELMIQQHQSSRY